MKQKRILLIEDEPGLVMTIQDRLTASSYATECVQDGASLEKILFDKSVKEFPDLIILDIMLPDTDGFSICKEIRAHKYTMPVLMLTAKTGIEDRVLGLKVGADDYLCKPFSMAELMARIEALLRRAAHHPDMDFSAVAAENPEVLQFGDFTLDLAGRILRHKNKPAPINLSTTEFRLLAFFALHPDKVLTRDSLLDSVWGYNNEVSSRTVDVHVAWLRQKLEEPDPPRHILTYRKGGYKFQF